MKRYLNADDKKDLLQIVLYEDAMNNTVQRWNMAKRKGLEAKYFRMAVTLLHKVANLILDGLDPIELEKLTKGAKNMVALMCYTSDAKRERSQMLAMDDVLPIKTQDLYYIAEQACEICKTCTMSADKEAKCELRRVMSSYDVPVYSCEAEGCPYRIDMEVAV